MEDDYDLFIDDYKPTKADIIKKINDAIKNGRAATKTPPGLELDVPPEWVDILQNDAAILYDYGEVGWKIMWYNIHSDGPGDGDLIRSWISIRDKRHVAKD
tara:strand:+ start:506 stop:808 length:303 start_codon:yes stop_codon:yes gene_type:complete